MQELKGRHVHRLNLDEYAPNALHRAWLHLANNGLGEPIRIPLLVARGSEPGPVLGLTAALHGNELNGIRVIQKLFSHLDTGLLRGTVVGVLAANVPAVVREQRYFNDGVDLNRIAPGRPNGNQSEVYIHRLVDRLVSRFEYLLDLHTASAGRINAFYIRAEMSDPATARMAHLQGADIILHDPPDDYTLRGTAASRGIKAITVELCDPATFQKDVIEQGVQGAYNVMVDLNMIDGTLKNEEHVCMICRDSSWSYTDEGGILSVLPELNEMLEAGAPIAVVKDIFGETVKTFYSERPGIVIGKSVNPINQTGSRILHLGYDPQPAILDSGDPLV
jgi:predicted deacylase